MRRDQGPSYFERELGSVVNGRRGLPIEPRCVRIGAQFGGGLLGTWIFDIEGAQLLVVQNHGPSHEGTLET